MIRRILIIQLLTMPSKNTLLEVLLLVRRIKSVAQLPQKLLRHILHGITLALSCVEHRNGVVHEIQLFLDLHAQKRWDLGSQQPLNRTIDWQGRNDVFLLVILELGERLRRRLAQRRRLVYDEGLVVFLEIVDNGVLGRGDMDAQGDCVDQGVEGFDVGEARQCAVLAYHLRPLILDSLVVENRLVGTQV